MTQEMHVDEARAIFREDDDEESGGAPRAALPFGRGILAVTALLALAGAAALFHSGASTASFLASSPARSPVISMPAASREAGFETNGADPCDGLPFLKLTEVLHNNLGNQGPDEGEEGLFYKGEDTIHKTPIILRIYAKSSYAPNKASENGFNGRYGTINLKGGSSVDLEFQLFDENEKPLTVDKVDFTFFDLDTGKDGATTEYIKVKTYDKAIFQSESELVETQLAPGYSEFKATTEGSGEDNPDDPSLLTSQQKNRAVSLVYSNLQTATVTIAASKGKTPRFFMFVARPSVLCAVTVDDNGKPRMPIAESRNEPTTTLEPRLPMLQVLPGQTGLRCPELDGCGPIATFVKWHVQTGDRVDQGTRMATIQNGDERRILRAPRAGVVYTLQPLKAGDVLYKRMSDYTLAVMEDILSPLTVMPGEAPLEAPRGIKFEAWKTRAGEYVEKGDAVAVVSKDGEQLALNASQSGVVTAEQPLRPGHSIWAIMKDRVVAVLRPCLRSLDVDTDFQMPIEVQPLSTFVEWKVKRVDFVEKNDPIAIVSTKMGTQMTTVAITTPRAGIVEATQPLRRGDSIDARLMDRVIATVGSRWPPLEVNEAAGEMRVTSNPGMYFVRYHKAVNEWATVGSPVAEVSFEEPLGRHLQPQSHSGILLRAPRSGKVLQQQPLRKGDKIGLTVMGVPPTLMTIGKGGALGPPLWLWCLLGWLSALCGVFILFLLVCRQEVGGQKKEEPYTPLSEAREPALRWLPPFRTATAKGLRIDFVDESGSVRTIIARHRPLGIIEGEDEVEAPRAVPIVVKDFVFNSYAAHLGVQRGWSLVRIGDTYISSLESRIDAKVLLSREIQDLPIWPLPISMDNFEDGTVSRYNLERRPLGIQFASKAPIRIQSCGEGSYARSIGIKDWKHDQEKWSIKRIADVECGTGEYSFQQMIDMLTEGTKGLDPWDGSPHAHDQLRGWD
mmetsp:Transcript_112127/g.250523  ORF Transcript_112127/g.250523 Transcript_112127/m.250523 type:complete len:957 (-) Transcript_112127:120-2990(-)